MNTGLSLKRVGGMSALAGALTLGVAVFASQAALAGGNPHFEGILSAAHPTGFMSSPDAYDISGGPVTVNFDVDVTNQRPPPADGRLNFSAHHILTYNGVDVSDGQPGQPGITFSGPAGTTQALMPGTQSFTQTWAPDATETLSLTYTFDACGYYQLDVWAPFSQGGDSGSGDAGLRVHPRARVQASPTPTPTPTADAPTPTGGVGARPPTPSGGVQGITTPTTGAGSGWLTIGAALLIAGAGMLVDRSTRAPHRHLEERGLSTMEIRDYLRAIRRILPLLIILPIVAAVITGFFLEKQPSKYEANATVVVPAISGNGTSQSAASQYVNTFKDVLVSEPVVTDVSQKYNIPVSELVSGLSADTVTASSNIITCHAHGAHGQNLTARCARQPSSPWTRSRSRRCAGAERGHQRRRRCCRTRQPQSTTSVAANGNPSPPPRTTNEQTALQPAGQLHSTATEGRSRASTATTDHRSAAELAADGSNCSSTSR